MAKVAAHPRPKVVARYPRLHAPRAVSACVRLPFLVGARWNDGRPTRVARTLLVSLHATCHPFACSLCRTAPYRYVQLWPPQRAPSRAASLEMMCDEAAMTASPSRTFADRGVAPTTAPSARLFSSGTDESSKPGCVFYSSFARSRQHKTCCAVSRKVVVVAHGARTVGLLPE